jgi:UDP-glucose 4-epimerase
MGRREGISIFGTDYPTPDGTCVRDYIHVDDLVDAHATVLGALRPGETRVYNLGIGRGVSVRELIDATKRVTGTDFPVTEGDRAPGDPAMLYCDPTRIQSELGWRAEVVDVETMIETAWRWMEAHPQGYTP